MTINPFTQAARNQYLDLLREGQTFTGAAGLLGFSYYTVLKYRNKHPAYNEKCKETIRSKVHLIADDLYLAAHAGDVDAMKFFLINRSKVLPADEQWHNVNKIEMTGKDGTPIQIAVDTGDLDELHKALRDAMARAAALMAEDEDEVIAAPVSGTGK